MNRLAITKLQMKNHCCMVWILMDEKREFIDFQLFEPEEQVLMDRIYIGKVENVLPNIQAAFVRIGASQRCFFPLEEIPFLTYTKKLSQKKELCIGDEILVQVVRDAVKTKEPVVSAKLTLSSNHALLTTANRTLGVSAKIPTGERETFDSLLTALFASPPDFGIVIRTNARHADVEDVGSDIRHLVESFQGMMETAVHKTAPSLIYEPAPGYVKRLKATDFSQIDKILTDDTQCFQNIKKHVPGVKEKLVFYQDPSVRLSTLYHIKGNLDTLLSNRVWLKSGANIIIETMETLTVVDVNTAKNIHNDEETILHVNLEAAEEIARQLRLRNISGMIIIDFINMTGTEQNQKLDAFFKKEIRKDPVQCSWIDRTKLGLVELTRKKVYKSLKEIVRSS